jgi:hypothetical protein
MEQLAREIAATYDDELYSDLPRMATIPVHVFLVMYCTATTDDASKATKYVIDLLRACGYKVDVQDNKICHVAPTMNSFAWAQLDVVRQPLMDRAIEAYFSRDMKTAKHLFAFAASLERICLGGDAETAKMRSKYSI